MKQLLYQALKEIGDPTKVQTIRRVSGGDINEAYYVNTQFEQYFVKYNRNIPKGFFQKEFRGLERIRETKAISVPKVFYVFENEREGILVMEWIEGVKKSHTEEELGWGVARLHQTTTEKFGFDEDSFIGKLPQPNQWYDHWIDYYRECRLLPQMKLAEKLGRMPTYRKQRLTKVMESLDKWLPSECQPSLLHGDLWGGNWLIGPNGTPYLIDPSVFYGHYEFELAFTELFGGFSDTFYRSYQEIQQMSFEYEERKPLYQLYYLLVHLNLFGEMYGPSVDRILTRYS